MYQFNPASWTDGTTIPHASDFQNIAADIATFGGTCGAAGYGLTGLGYFLLKPQCLPGTLYTISAASWTSSVSTYTIPTHTLVVGQLISVTAISPTGYNVALVPVTAISTYTFSVAQSSNPGTYTSGGTVQSNGVSAANGMLAVDTSGNLQLYWSGSWHNLG